MNPFHLVVQSDPMVGVNFLRWFGDAVIQPDGARQFLLAALLRLRQDGRVGIVPPVVNYPHMETIEVGGFGMLDLGHGYFAEAKLVMEDIREAIETRKRAGDRTIPRPYEQHYMIDIRQRPSSPMAISSTNRYAAPNRGRFVGPICSRFLPGRGACGRGTAPLTSNVNRDEKSVCHSHRSKEAPPWEKMMTTIM